MRQAKLDYDDWVAGLREGRNYASDGKSHLIDFRVNEVEMGSGKDVELPAAGTVKVTAKVAAFLDEQPNDAIRKAALRPEAVLGCRAGAHRQLAEGARRGCGERSGRR